MAIRAAIGGTGNFKTAGTWELVDQSSTTGSSYLNSQTGTDTLTTAYSGTVSATFLWAVTAPTIDGIGIKISDRTGTTGTISVHLEVATVEVAGTAVTIDMADLPAIATADINGGWMFFKFAAPVALSAATSYSVAAKTSTGSMCNVYRDGTTDNLSRYLRTTTTGAPAAGDDLIITGEYVDQSTNTAVVVTMNNDTSDDFGSTPSAANSLIGPGIAICQNGTLTWSVTTGSTYSLKMSNSIIVYSGGNLSMGTSGTPVERGAIAYINFDCGNNVDYGLVIRNLGTFNAQGLSRTVGNNSYYCKLNTDEATNSTSLGVDTDTGWLDNDEIAVASTTRTASQCESGTLNGNAGASTLTVDGFAGAGGGLANSHSGTSPTQAEVILLTRNVKIYGASASLQSYIDIKATATVDADWAEFKWLGSATANKRGIDTACTTGVQSWQYCSRHTSTVASSLGWNMSGASGTGLTISNNVTFNIANSHFLNSASSGSSILDSNIFIRNSDSFITLMNLGDNGGTYTNNVIAGSAGIGILFNETAAVGTFSGNTVHSCNDSNILLGGTGVFNSTFTNTISWRSNAKGISFPLVTGIIFNTLTLFGNTTSNIDVANGTSGAITFISVTANGDTTFATTNGITTGSTNARASIGGWKIFNGDFSTVAGIKTAHTNDINISSANTFFQCFLNNTKLGAATEVATQSNLIGDSFVKSQKHDQTAATHKSWFRYGTIDLEGTIVHTGSQSMRMLPNNASNKLESASFYAAVANGATVTPSVYVRESAAYNGNRCRLIVKRNDAIGITADTVLDTRSGASDAVFEEMTGTTAAATDDGVMEFVVDCDGTAGTGYVYVDSFTVS